MTTRIIITGSKGQLGRSLQQVIADRAGCEVVGAWDVDELDICDRDAIARARDLYLAEAEVRPSGAGLTNVGRAIGYLVRADVRDQQPTLPRIRLAASWFEKAVLHDPTYAEGWDSLAIAMNQLGLELRRQRQPREAAAGLVTLAVGGLFYAVFSRRG